MFGMNRWATYILYTSLTKKIGSKYFRVWMIPLRKLWMQVKNFLSYWKMIWKKLERIFFHVQSAWKVSVFGVFLVRIFSHLNWIRKDTPYLSVLSPNTGKYRLEKLTDDNKRFLLRDFKIIFMINERNFGKKSSLLLENVCQRFRCQLCMDMFVIASFWRVNICSVFQIPCDSQGNFF